MAPARLAPLNRAWTALALLLFKVVNPAVLGMSYLTTIVPTRPTIPGWSTLRTTSMWLDGARSTM